MDEPKKRDLLALASVPLMMTLGNSMLIPVLPKIEQEIGINPFESSLIISLYSIVSILFIPLAGFLSDRIGRKNTIIPSLSITGVGGILSGLSAWLIKKPYYFILAGRLVQGLGAAGAFPVVIPTVGDMYKKDSDVSKGLGVIETFNTAGKVLSPVLGSLLAAIVWFAPFWFILVFSVFSIILVGAFVKVSKSKEDKDKTSFADFFARTKDILKENGRWLYSIFYIGFVCMYVYFSFLIYLSSTLESKFKISSIIKGLLIAIPLVILCTASFVTGKVIGRNTRLMRGVAIAGSLVTAAGLLSLMLFKGLAAQIALLSAAAGGVGAILPSVDALITEGIEKEHRGSITSFFSSARMLGVTVGPPVSALLMGAGYAVFFVPAAVALSCIPVLLLFVDPEECKKSSTT